MEPAQVVLANTSIELSRRNLDRMFNIMFPPKVEVRRRSWSHPVSCGAPSN